MAPTDTFPQRREVRHLDCHRQDHLVRERSRWSVLLRHRTSTVLLYLSISLSLVRCITHSLIQPRTTGREEELERVRGHLRAARSRSP